MWLFRLGFALLLISIYSTTILLLSFMFFFSFYSSLLVCILFVYSFVVVVVVVHNEILNRIHLDSHSFCFVLYLFTWSKLSNREKKKKNILSDFIFFLLDVCIIILYRYIYVYVCIGWVWVYGVCGVISYSLLTIYWFFLLSYPFSSLIDFCCCGGVCLFYFH